MNKELTNLSFKLNATNSEYGCIDMWWKNYKQLRTQEYKIDKRFVKHRYITFISSNQYIVILHIRVAETKVI